MLRRRSCWFCHWPATERERETSLLSNPLTIVVVVVLWNLRSETDPTEKCEKMDLILQRVEEPLRSNSVCSRTPTLTLPYEPEEFPFFLEKKTKKRKKKNNISNIDLYFGRVSNIDTNIYM